MKTRPWWAGSSACKSWRRWASAPARAQTCNQVSANGNTRTPCNAHKVTAIGGCTLASKAREKNCTAILSGMSVGVPACSDDGTALATHRGVGMTKTRAHALRMTRQKAQKQQRSRVQQGATGWRHALGMYRWSIPGTPGFCFSALLSLPPNCRGTCRNIVLQVICRNIVLQVTLQHVLPVILVLQHVTL